MDKSQEILSSLIIFNKYAKHIPEVQRRETWEEICDRNMSMHVRKFPVIKKDIQNVYNNFVKKKTVLPSMRSMQFAGMPIELSNSRIFNCAYMPIEHPFAFAELMFLLLGGTGVGYSVQKRHISKLPVIEGPSSKTRRFLIGDSIEGWADAIKVIVKAYTQGKSDPIFDYRDIRPKGARLVTSGGKAPGPDPLRICVEHIRSILNGAIGRQLTTLEVHDMCCYIADAVLAGGIRRAAMICGFDMDDMDMLYCKTGRWYELNPQRGRSNNSVILKRGEVTEEHFKLLWEQVKRSGAGEPGFFWTNDYDVFTNPCCEISLNAYQFCNLTEVNASDLESQEELNSRCRAAAIIGTVQAAYTDFHYLRPIWKETTEKEALIGVGLTGIGSGAILKLDLAEGAEIVKTTNAEFAEKIGINAAARTTTVKPSGTSSCVVGSSSGIHAWHNDHYIRRVRVGKNEALYRYLLQNMPDLVEDCVFKPHLEAVISIPQKAPEGSILRTESPMKLLERVKKFNLEWVRNGYRSGSNHHNVSCTISIKDKEWDKVGKWMWDNREDYTGIAVIPYDGGTYVQAPFEDCTVEKYEELLHKCKNIDLTKVVEVEDDTSLVAELACAGGACEITV
jgi:ribonucleoside-triphosphate reductase